jgi:hypothetical protein
METEESVQGIRICVTAYLSLQKTDGLNQARSYVQHLYFLTTLCVKLVKKFLLRYVARRKRKQFDRDNNFRNCVDLKIVESSLLSMM